MIRFQDGVSFVLPRAFRSTFLVALSAVLLIMQQGCGGGSGSSGSSSNTQSQTLAESVAFQDGQIGALTVTAASGGNASGTLVVSGVTGSGKAVKSAAASEPIPHGSYAVSGTVVSGQIALGGTANGVAFTLTGALPSGTGSGSIVLAQTGTDISGSLTTAATGATADAAIAGTYLSKSLTNPVSGVTVTCPGSLAFSSSTANGNDECAANETVILGANGNISAGSGSPSIEGSYSVTGNIVYFVGTETGNGEAVKRYFQYTLTGNTLVLTMLYSSNADEAAQAGELEELTYTKTGS